MDTENVVILKGIKLTYEEFKLNRICQVTALGSHSRMGNSEWYIIIQYQQNCLSFNLNLVFLVYSTNALG